MAMVADLTERETRMLELLAAGASTERIAEATGLRPGTTRVYLHNLYRKINVDNRLQAAVWYLRRPEVKEPAHG